MAETLTGTREDVDQLKAAEQSASAILDAAERLFSGGEMAEDAYVRELQKADITLAECAEIAAQAGIESEVRRLRQRRAFIDVSMARLATSLGNGIGSQRERSIAALNSIFRLGHAPDAPHDGAFRGRLLSSTLFGPLDTYGRTVARFYMPWKGKRFDAEKAVGGNIFTKSATVTGRLFWPFYGGWQRYKPGYYTGFRFDTYLGQGVNDPAVTTLKLDYDNPGNPRFLVRSVLDEVVQITGNFYLGKAMLWQRDGNYRLAAFFTLRR